MSLLAGRLTTGPRGFECLWSSPSAAAIVPSISRGMWLDLTTRTPSASWGTSASWSGDWDRSPKRTSSPSSPSAIPAPPSTSRPKAFETYSTLLDSRASPALSSTPWRSRRERRCSPRNAAHLLSLHKSPSSCRSARVLQECPMKCRWSLPMDSGAFSPFSTAVPKKQ